MGEGEALADERLEETIRVARSHPGPAALQVVLRNGGERAQRLRSRALSVMPDPETLSELRRAFGRDRVRLVHAPGQPA